MTASTWALVVAAYSAGVLSVLVVLAFVHHPEPREYQVERRRVVDGPDRSA